MNIFFYLFLELDGRCINEYVFFNIDYLLVMEYFLMLLIIRIVFFLDCFR